MKRFLSTTSLLCLLSAPALAQTAVGTGVGIANSESKSGAIAVNRGNGNSNSSLTVNNPANQTIASTVSGTTTQNLNQNVSGSTTSNVNSRVSGSTTVRSAPSMVAPGLAAAGLETCLGSASGTVSAIGFGIGGGSTYADEGCQARLDSRTLYAYGLKAAAVARLCQRADIWRSMPDMCAQYWPAGVPYPAGVYVAGAQANITMSTDSAASGVTRVIDGRDGVEKDCLNYSYKAQKCYQWLGEKPHVRHAAITQAGPQTASIRKPKPKAEKPPTAPTAPPVFEEPKT